MQEKGCFCLHAVTSDAPRVHEMECLSELSYPGVASRTHCFFATWYSVVPSSALSICPLAMFLCLVSAHDCIMPISLQRIIFSLASQ